MSLRYRDGDCAEVVFDLRTTGTEIMLSARVTGRYALQYRRISVALPRDEQRPISVDGAGAQLVEVECQ